MLSRIEDDWTTAGLSEKRFAMLAYATKLTVTPWDVVEADIAVLRTAGFGERDILDIAEVTAYYAYVNRIADGLGVAMESWIPQESS